MIKKQIALKTIEVLGHHLSIYGTFGEPMFVSKEVSTIIGFDSDVSAVGRFVRPAAEKDRFQFKVKVGNEWKIRSFLNLKGLSDALAHWKTAYPKSINVQNAVSMALIENRGIADSIPMPMSDEEILAKALLIAKAVAQVD